MSNMLCIISWAPSSEFVSSSIPSWQILTAHAQPFRGARDLALCLKVPLDSLLVWASSGGSGETAWMHRLAWTFADRIGDKYQIRLMRSSYTDQVSKTSEGHKIFLQNHLHKQSGMELSHKLMGWAPYQLGVYTWTGILKLTLIP